MCLDTAGLNMEWGYHLWLNLQLEGGSDIPFYITSLQRDMQVLHPENIYWGLHGKSSEELSAAVFKHYGKSFNIFL